MTHYTPRTQTHETTCAVIFTSLIVLVLVTSILFAFNSTGPIILGTELNTNGLVEYICLGNGCENYTQFAWID
ncbi:MAG: hypothetical protein KTR28_09300 [Micavibrio sp.]|nr:hypothetical protein [Micavibrio sp.]